MIGCDPIVDEVRRARDAYAARFHYDLRAICRDLKEQEKRSGRKVDSYANESESIRATEPTGLSPEIADPRPSESNSAA